MSRSSKMDKEDLTQQIQAMLAEGETLLWWDKLSDKSLIGGFGKTLIYATLFVNAAILALIFAPPLLPGAASMGWLMLPLLIVDGVCMLFILLYFAFGLMTGGVNVISDQRALLADVHKNRIVRSIRLDSLSAIRIRRERGQRGSITFLREVTADSPATAAQPRRLALVSLRHVDRVLALLREQTGHLQQNDGG